MRSRILYYLGIMTTALLIYARPAAAQLNCWTFSDDLGEYDSEVLSSDGTTIYSLVEIDGSQEMDIQPSCYWLTPTHTPEATNLLILGSQYVGGAEWGTGVCGSCYISFTNEQSITPPPGADATVTFQSEARADCNIAGTFFETGLDERYLTLAITETTGSLLVCTVGGNNGGDLGTYKPACSTGIPTCPRPVDGSQFWEVGFGEGEDCWEYVKTGWVAFKVDGNLEECFASPLSQQEAEPGPCN